MASADNREPWLTKRELADLLKVSSRTIERLSLPCMRVGDQNRYLMSEVEAALKGREDERLLTTGDVAAELNIGEDWVREHAAELGGIRAGRGPRAPLRFERSSIEAWIERQRLDPPAAAEARRRSGPKRKPRLQVDFELLPLPEEGRFTGKGRRNDSR